jgi:hypothetical protein
MWSMCGCRLETAKHSARIRVHFPASMYNFLSRAPPQIRISRAVILTLQIRISWAVILTPQIRISRAVILTLQIRISRAVILTLRYGSSDLQPEVEDLADQ